jgi:hypothetical protein
MKGVLSFLFLGSASCYTYFIKVIRRALPRNNSSRYLFYLYFIAATCFGRCWPSSSGIHNYFRKLLYLQWIRCFALLGPSRSSGIGRSPLTPYLHTTPVNKPISTTRYSKSILTMHGYIATMGKDEIEKSFMKNCV